MHEDFMVSPTTTTTTHTTQVMHKHDVVFLSEVSRGQAAVALCRTVQQRGIAALDVSHQELEVPLGNVVRVTGMPPSSYTSHPCAIKHVLTPPHHLQTPSNSRLRRVHDKVLIKWHSQDYAAAVKTCVKVLRDSSTTPRTLPDLSLEAVDLRAVAQQTADFGNGGLQMFQDAQAVLHDMARLLQLMLVVLGPVRGVLTSYVNPCVSHMAAAQAHKITLWARQVLVQAQVREAAMRMAQMHGPAPWGFNRAMALGDIVE